MFTEEENRHRREMLLIEEIAAGASPSLPPSPQLTTSPWKPHSEGSTRTARVGRHADGA